MPWQLFWAGGSEDKCADDDKYILTIHTHCQQALWCRIYAADDSQMLSYHSNQQLCVQWPECMSDISSVSLDTNRKSQHVKSSSRYDLAAPPNFRPSKYWFSFPRDYRYIADPVDGFRERATIHTNLRMYYMKYYVIDSIIILDKGKKTYTCCDCYDLNVT